MPVKDPCKAFACRIQSCLKEHHFQESACQDVIEDMRECCRIWKDKSFVCGGIDITKEPKNKKYPRLFVGTVTTVFMLAFFSKPIYDIFLSDHIIDVSELRKPDTSSKK